MILFIKKKLRGLLVRIKRKNIDSHTQRTILCNMCLGGVISHDFGLCFNSPTVNLSIPAGEFVSMLQDISQVDGEIVLKYDSRKSYPVGILNNLYTLHFIHYETFKEAVDAWRRRTKRMDRDNPYVILVETASCSYDDLIRFDKLPYKHKIALVHCKYPEIHCSVVVKGYDGKNLHGDILNYLDYSWSRMYDQVDWIRFLELKK